MEEVRDLIRRYGLEEDQEHVIIPVRVDGVRRKRIFLLKRRYIRVMYQDGHFVDYPLPEVIEATVAFPDLPLSEAIYLIHKESSGIEVPAEEKTFSRKR